MKEPGYLLVYDFDGTVANTFEPNPKGMGVNEAYAKAITEIFGDKGFGIYEKAGGLKNQAPEEIVSLILDDDSKLIDLAEECFDKKSKTLARLVPPGKGAPLEWASNDQERTRRTIAEMLVLLKLSYLMDEIGSKFEDGRVWPRPCKGFIELLRMIDVLVDEGIDIQGAIISSGHESFIKKTFACWHEVCPQILLTDDDMRGAKYPAEFQKRVKPSPFLFDIIQAKWISNGVLFSDYARHIELFRESRQRMMYFGDDLRKDGKLAEYSGVPFGLFRSDNPTCTFPFHVYENNSFVFGDWEEIAYIFESQKAILMLRDGRPMTQIISLY